MNDVVNFTGNGTYEPYDFGSAEPLAREGIKINGKDFILREPSEAAVVSRCLFQVTPNTGGGRTEVQVGVHEILSWKGSICSKLFDFIKEMCPWLMGEETEESLTKEIAKLQKRLEKVRKAKPEEGAEGSSKNLHSATPTT
jgi:hypothetical protein